MQEIKVYNTLTKQKTIFKPVIDGEAKIYVCGVTPYNHPHIGNARPSVTWDVIRRYLEYVGYKVVLVQNFTDVDDKIINKAKEKGNRVIAVGTTSVRTLESSVDENGKLIASEGNTNIFIYGDYNFKITDAIITNIHLPKSTLIMLISAFGGKEFVFEAYKKAVEEKYRFYSFGDSMFIY